MCALLCCRARINWLIHGAAYIHVCVYLFCISVVLSMKRYTCVYVCVFVVVLLMDCLFGGVSVAVRLVVASIVLQRNLHGCVTNISVTVHWMGATQ